MPRTKLLPSLALISSMLIVAGCQKTIHEVRRTEPDKYTVDTGSYAVSSGNYHAQTISASPAAGRYDSGFRLGSPSAPRLAPAALHTPPQTIGHD